MDDYFCLHLNTVVFRIATIGSVRDEMKLSSQNIFRYLKIRIDQTFDEKNHTISLFVCLSETSVELRCNFS